MREETAGGHVNRIGSGLLQPLTDFHGVLNRIASSFGENHGVVVVGGADLHLQMEIVAHAGANRTHDFQQKAHAVFERAAVLVVAIINRRRETA